MVLGVCSGVLGEVVYDPGLPSDGEISPVVYEGSHDPSMGGYQMVAYGPPAKYGEYELLDGAIWGEIYYFYREHTGDPYSDKMAAKWSVTDAVYRVIYVYVDGSNCGNLYEYGDIQGDSGLHAPLKGGNVPDIHHITFYYTIEEPEEPGEPEEPEEPDEPEEPEGPGQPDEPEEPEGPEQPEEPEEPEGPEQPGEPEEPEGPGQPDEPEEPEGPEQPEEPEEPAEPKEPGEPEEPEELEEIEEEEVPLSPPSSGEAIPDEEAIAEEDSPTDTAEELIAEAEIPLTILPTTGGVSAEILYGLGILVSGIGAVIRKHSKE